MDGRLRTSALGVTGGRQRPVARLARSSSESRHRACRAEFKNFCAKPIPLICNLFSRARMTGISETRKGLPAIRRKGCDFGMTQLLEHAAETVRASGLKCGTSLPAYSSNLPVRISR